MKKKEQSLKIAKLLLQINAIKINLANYFTWASGLKSPIYCDNRKTLSYPETRNFIKEEFVNAIKNNSPDIVVMPGDIIDDRRPIDKTLEFLEEITKLYPCYYVSGNHEIRIDNLAYVKSVIRNNGIEVLDGNCKYYENLSISGIDDYELGKETWYKQLGTCSSNLETKNFNMLLSHRPERYADYMKYDLVITGHAHGGQWRVPHIFNGIYSPNQGLFPKHAGGIYELDNTTLVVSRGLAKESTRLPRVFNPPEVVIITIN
jgi:predicted MPP superfamily phosphohydrolase